jgi:hypothetical protein
VSRKEAREGTRKAARRPSGCLSRVAGVVAGAVLSLLSLPFLLLAVWGLLFSAPTLAVLAFTAAWILFPLFNGVRAVRVFKLSLLFVLVAATLALAPQIVREVDQQVERLSRKPRSDMSTFALRDRLGIYGLNIVMSAAGYPLYPEAAKETLLMMFDPGPLARRVFYTDFGLGSVKVGQRLGDFAARLRTDDTASSPSLGPVRIMWEKTDYRLNHPEARYALALNQTLLTARAERRGKRWLIDVQHEMEVKYPESLMVTLVTRPRLRMEEGLFWVLQNYGWLYPYVAEYRFSVYSDDPRLKCSPAADRHALPSVWKARRQPRRLPGRPLPPR